MTLLSVRDDKAMRALGARLAEVCQLGAIIYLVGELGAGKSTLARGFLRALGHEGSVRSPTYTLVESYDLPVGHIYHLDLYRLADPEELAFLGLRDWLTGHAILLVEWPQRGEGVLPLADVTVTIVYDGKARGVTVMASSEKGRQIVAALVEQR